MKIAILGTAGLPANYGGFETLVNHLIIQLDEKYSFNVFCSSKSYKQKIKKFRKANLSYLPFKANGFQSIIYDIIAIFKSFKNNDILLILGVSGCIILPFIKPLFKGKIITNIDGLEWKRDKWKKFIKYYLKLSEKMAVKYSDEVIADNEEIKNYIDNQYNVKSNFIPYGGDHTIKLSFTEKTLIEFPFLINDYAFTVCRIEPENNIHIIIDAFSQIDKLLVLVGNWNSSNYGKTLRKNNKFKNIYLLDPIYDQEKLDELRSNCKIYIHGHSAGGTNPSLVEAMFLGLPIIAYDVIYNRATTSNEALYFTSSKSLIQKLLEVKTSELESISKKMKKLAEEKYKWEIIASNYERLFIKKKFSMKLLLLLLLINIQVFPQYVPTPDNKVHSFLENVSIKNNYKYDFFDRFIDRRSVTEHLNNFDSLNLTSLEKEELDFYKKEYSFNEYSSGFTLFSNDINGRWRVFGYKDNFFSIYLDPVLGYEFRSVKGELVKHRFNGFSVYGTLGNSFGFDIKAWDNEEAGKYIDMFKYFSPVTGNNLVKATKDAIEYDELIVNMHYSWEWGSISVGKNYFNWGSGRNGQIILSDKAPAIPYIKLEIYPVEWFKFSYLHGWLHSMVMDSSTFRFAQVLDINTFSQVNKYIAAHYLSINPKKNITFTLGESVIYSDEIEYMYLIPIMFFRAIDHNMQERNSNSGDNMQIFADLNYVVPEIKSRFYGTVFIDELSVTDLLKGGNLSTIAYTLGGEVIEPILNNSSFLVEFTQLAPFTYMNSDITQTFRSRGYQLGHWIGSNSRQIYAEYEQRIIRGLGLKLFGEYTISGQIENPEDQYRFPYPKTLYGAKRKATRLGLGLDYEFIHTLKAKFDYQYSYLTDEDPNRTYEWQLGKNNYLSFGISYGF